MLFNFLKNNIWLLRIFLHLKILGKISDIDFAITICWKSLTIHLQTTELTHTHIKKKCAHGLKLCLCATYGLKHFFKGKIG